MPPYILLTVDVEDWFQVENLKGAISFESWPAREVRVERNTHRILDLLDSIEMKETGDRIQEAVQKIGNQACGFKMQQATGNMRTKNSPKATFFVLGWLAERLPHLVREIHSRGHEVASHGCNHDLPAGMPEDELGRDLRESRERLEDIIGDRLYGFRSPSFSISDDILRVIQESGYLYDSSYNSFSLHGRYGRVSLNGGERRGVAYRISDGFYELPISNLMLKKPVSSTRPAKFFKKDSEADLTGELSALSSEKNRGCLVLPWGGGAYFRLIPTWLFLRGVRSILEKQGAYLFYIHPWEVDPGQPRPEGLGYFLRFKHYTNLAKTHQRLDRLMKAFSNCRFVTCAQYLKVIPVFTVDK